MALMLMLQRGCSDPSSGTIARGAERIRDSVRYLYR